MSESQRHERSDTGPAARDRDELAGQEPAEPRVRVTKGRPWRIGGSRRAKWSGDKFVVAHAVEIRQVGDPLLHAPAKKPRLGRTALEDLAARMFASMIAARGIGLAAPQIGVPLRVAIIDVDEAGVVAVEPRIEWTTEELAEASEGCLSVRGLYAMLERPVGARLTALDLTGRRFTLEGVELGAQCMLHEIDHLEGRLYVDRLRSRADLRPVEPEQDDTSEDPAAGLSAGPGPRSARGVPAGAQRRKGAARLGPEATSLDRTAEVAER